MKTNGQEIESNSLDNMEYPPFSVAMSVYKNDNAEWFDTAMDSVVYQTVQPDEIVLVVDGPVPESVQNIIQKYCVICKSEKINFNPVRFQENRGLGNALKVAVSQCRNDIIARMDSDDIAVSDRFEQQLKIFEKNPKVEIVGGDIQEFISQLEHKAGQRKVPVSNAEIRTYMKSRCPFNHVTVMYKKASVMRAGGYQDLFWNEDYYLWIRMAEKGSMMSNTGTILCNVRVSEDMYMRRGGIRYFRSERYLQKYMLQHGMINYFEYAGNLAKRFVVQVLLPNTIRGWVFRKFARE